MYGLAISLGIVTVGSRDEREREREQNRTEQNKKETKQNTDTCHSLCLT